MTPLAPRTPTVRDPGRGRIVVAEDRRLPAPKAPHQSRFSRGLLPPVRPNAGLEERFRSMIDELVREMNNSVDYWLCAAYGRNEPKIAGEAGELAEAAQDARRMIRGGGTPAAALTKIVQRLRRQWTRRFEEVSEQLAQHFALAVADRSDRTLAGMLRKGGFSVEFKMTGAMRDVVTATVNQSVGLIRSIPQQYLGEVEGLVMRSVQTGRDLGQLREDLSARYDITKRRAALIARDQNNKATSAMTRARQIELGLTEAIWVHSGGGKEPRPTHLAKNNKPYSITEGWYDPAEGRHIFPGELINCRCVSRAVLPGHSF